MQESLRFRGKTDLIGMKKCNELRCEACSLVKESKLVKSMLNLAQVKIVKVQILSIDFTATKKAVTSYILSKPSENFNKEIYKKSTKKL